MCANEKERGRRGRRPSDRATESRQRDDRTRRVRRVPTADCHRERLSGRASHGAAHSAAAATSVATSTMLERFHYSLYTRNKIDSEPRYRGSPVVSRRDAQIIIYAISFERTCSSLTTSMPRHFRHVGFAMYADARKGHRPTGSAIHPRKRNRNVHEAVGFTVTRWRLTTRRFGDNGIYLQLRHVIVVVSSAGMYVCGYRS